MKKNLPHFHLPFDMSSFSGAFHLLKCFHFNFHTNGSFPEYFQESGSNNQKDEERERVKERERKRESKSESESEREREGQRE